VSQFKELSYSPGGKHGRRLRSPTLAEGLHMQCTYNGVRPGSTLGPFTTLLSLPQFLAAFSTVPPTLAWVYQSPVSQPLSTGYVLHTWYRLSREPRCGSPRNPEVRTRDWIYGRQNWS
jgi:hypothetical protein